MLKHTLALTLTLLAAACTSSSTGSGTAPSAAPQVKINALQTQLTAPIAACSGLFSGSGFNTAPLLANGYAPQSRGAFNKILGGKDIFGAPGAKITVAPKRSGACNILLSQITTLQLGVPAVTRELTAQGWRKDQSTRKRIYRKGTAALLIDGGSYGSIVTFALRPA